jgi:hypothetical protein
VRVDSRLNSTRPQPSTEAEELWIREYPVVRTKRVLGLRRSDSDCPMRASFIVLMLADPIRYAATRRAQRVAFWESQQDRAHVEVIRWTRAFRDAERQGDRDHAAMYLSDARRWMTLASTQLMRLGVAQ